MSTVRARGRGFDSRHLQKMKRPPAREAFSFSRRESNGSVLRGASDHLRMPRGRAYMDVDESTLPGLEGVDRMSTTGSRLPPPPCCRFVSTTWRPDGSHQGCLHPLFTYIGKCKKRYGTTRHVTPTVIGSLANPRGRRQKGEARDYCDKLLKSGRLSATKVYAEPLSQYSQLRFYQWTSSIQFRQLFQSAAL